MDALKNWNALSSGSGKGANDAVITQVPGALLNLLRDLGKLAGNIADLIGLAI